MSLAGQTCWVVGGAGVIGRGICRGLLRSGATVVVNSRSSSRLGRLAADLGHPDKLVTVKGSLLPGQACRTVSETLGYSMGELNHVVAHSSVRWWAGEETDETRTSAQRGSLLDMRVDEFVAGSSRLAGLHFAAAQQLVPRLRSSTVQPTYTFVTGAEGDMPGSGSPGSPAKARSAMDQVNSMHTWGLATVLRHELALEVPRPIAFTELHIGMRFDRPTVERAAEPRARPLSSDIGDLCAGIAIKAQAEGRATWSSSGEGGKLAVGEQTELDGLLEQFPAKEEVELPKALWNWEGAHGGKAAASA